MSTAGSAAGDVEVRAEPGHDRFEILVDGRHAGYALYQNNGGTRVFHHTEVDDTFGGMGVGSRLIRAALDATRDAGLSVVATCSFVRHFIEEHPDYQDLLAA